MKFGIAYLRNLDDDFPTGKPGEDIHWIKDSNGNDRTWDDYGKALESNDIEYGWTGYVRYYPSGQLVKDTDK